MRCLLFAALLLGFGAMHTLGHAAGTSHTGHGPSAEADAATASTSDTAHSSADLPELDPTSVCLALGVFAVLLLGVAETAFTRWPEPILRTVSPFRWFDPLAVEIENKPSLSALQVLRI